MLYIDIANVFSFLLLYSRNLFLIFVGWIKIKTNMSKLDKNTASMEGKNAGEFYPRRALCVPLWRF